MTKKHLLNTSVHFLKVMLFFLTQDLVYNKTLFAFEVLELLYSLVKDSFSALDKSIFKYIFTSNKLCVFG